MLFNPEIETMPLHKLRVMQNDRLKQLVGYLYARVPFYKKRFDEAGIKPSTFKGLEDLHKLPFTKKVDFRDNYPFGLLAVPEKDIARLHCSSGTTGKSTVMGYTLEDLNIFTEVVARSLAAAGCKPGMKIQNGYGYGLFTGGLGLHYGAEKLGMTVIPVSKGSKDQQIALMRDFRPEVICCTPSYAHSLAEEIKKRNIPAKDINLQLAVLGAEPWTETIREHVQDGLNVKATNIYGLSEIIGPGVSQEDVDERGTGSYIWEDHFYPEIVDKDTGEPLPEGEYGVLVLTTLTKTGMPVVRYWTGDITNIYYEHSEKRTHVKMGPIKGRSDDMLVIKGVNFHHTQVEEILKGLEQVSPIYQVVATRSGTLDEVEVTVELNEKFQKELGVHYITDEIMTENSKMVNLKNQFSKKIKDNIGFSMKVNFVGYGQLPRSEGGKLNKVKDLRNILTD